MGEQKKETTIDEKLVKDLKDAFRFMQTYIAMFPAKDDSENEDDVAPRVAQELGIDDKRKGELIAFIKKSGATGLDDIKNFSSYAESLIQDDGKKVDAEKEEWGKAVKGLAPEEKFNEDFKKAEKDYKKKKRAHFFGSLWRIALIALIASITVFSGTLGFLGGAVLNFITTTAGSVLGGLSTAATSLLGLFVVDKFIVNKKKKDDKKGDFFDWFKKAKKEKQDAYKACEKLQTDRQKAIDDANKKGDSFKKHDKNHKNFAKEVSPVSESEEVYSTAASSISGFEKQVKSCAQADSDATKEQRLRWLQYIKSLIYKGIAEWKITKDNIGNVMARVKDKYKAVFSGESFQNLGLAEGDELSVGGIRGYMPKERRPEMTAQPEVVMG